jgi:peptidoglycan-N-acetylglucosamine deacetylase
MIVEGIALGTAAAAGVMAWGVRHPASQLFARSHHRGPADRPRVALTFDDGPTEGTLRLLEVLASQGVRATFFQCGAQVDRRPAIARQVLAAGHELGNHTQTHPALYFRSVAFMEQELASAQRSIAAGTGVTPRLFRPPYGVRWPGLGGVQERLGLTSILWSVIGRDWVLPAPEIAQRVLAAVEPGAIICLHDGRGLQANPDIAATIQATGVIMAELADRGYEFVTVSDLLCLS